VTVAEHDDVDVLGGELEPAHVLDEPVRGEPGVEQDTSGAARFLDRDEAREAVLGARRVAGQAAVEEPRGQAGVDGTRERIAFRGRLVRERRSVTLSTSVVTLTASTGSGEIAPIASRGYRRLRRRRSPP
jgi:hypothetical protein